ncbi:RNA polymerase sigma factor [Asticcacaulis sp. W401b]|uniref:RNA polymerase sigma factor n=1 Tax=Asticcacaulis sp. W401b TaxID=3388666 RepID=UPI00397048CA
MAEHRDNADRNPDALGQFRAPVRAYFQRRVASPSEAEDLTQEVFLRVIQRLERGPVDNLEGYLFHAASNLLKERGRQNTYRGAAQIIDLQGELAGGEEAHTPERILLGKDRIEALQRALLELPERTRHIFILNRFEEISGAQIARKLGLSVSAVEKHIVKALAHLKSVSQ